MLTFTAISLWMPPAVTPRSIQVARLIRHLRPQGWQASIVCHAPGSFEPPHFLDYDLSHEYADVVGYAKWVSLAPLPNTRRRDLVMALLRGGVPADQMERWRRRALAQAIRTIGDTGSIAFATFAAPWESHEIGLEIARCTKLPWLAHFADPWVDNPYFAGYPAERLERWRRNERAVAERADALVFTTEQTRDLVMGKYPAEWSERAYVVPHAFDAAILKALPPPASHRRMRLVHAGNFYGQRNAADLLAGLARLMETAPNVARDLDLRLVGVTEPDLRYKIAQMGLDETITIIGQRPYRETLFEAAAADLALVVDADLEPSPFLPSKLIDYAGLFRPMLAVTPRSSATAALMARMDCPVVAPHSPDELAGALADLHARWANGTLNAGPSYRRVVTEFEVEPVARRFALVLKQAVTTRLARL